MDARHSALETSAGNRAPSRPGFTLMFDSVEGEHRVFRFPPIGGVPAHHSVPLSWQMDPGYIPGWAVGSVLEDPICVLHVQGPLDSAELTPMSGIPAEDHFYRNRQGQIVVEFLAPTIWPTVSTHLVTERPGYSYRLHHTSAALPGEVPWIRHRLLYALSLPARERGFLVHAFGFRHPDGFGVLCPAPAGTGKSTLARLIRTFDPQISLFSDDRIVIRRESDRFDIHGTPWRSAARAADPGAAPLGALVFIKHGGAPAFRRVDSKEAMRRILQCAALPYWDAAQLDTALRHMDALISTIPAIECSYGLDVGAAGWMIDMLEQERQRG